MVEEAGQQQQMEVRVRSLDGQQVQLTVPLHFRVADLKLRLQELRWPSPGVTQFHLFLRGTKLTVDATVASLSLDGEFLVLITFTKKNQKIQTVNRSPTSQPNSAAQVPDHGGLQSGDVSTLPAGAPPSQGISHEDWLNGHAPSRVEAEPREDGSGNTHTRASEETWSAVAADLASFNTCLPEDPAVLRDVCEVGNQREQESFDGGEGKRSTRRGKTKRKGVDLAGPLPPAIEELKRVFTALNTVYGFLQRQRMQATWVNVKQSLQQLCFSEGNEKMCLEAVKAIAILCPKLMVLSNMSEEGENSSFSIDMFDPSKVDGSDPTQQPSLSVHQLQEIGAGDFLPSGDGKRMTDTQMRNAIGRRQRAFDTLLLTVFNHIQASSDSQNRDLNDLTVQEFLQTAKGMAPDDGKDLSKPGLPSALPRPPRHHKKLTRCKDISDMHAQQMLHHLKEKLGSLGQIVHCEDLQARPASYGHLENDLSQFTKAAIGRLGITKLYTHQAQAVNSVRNGRNIVVATSTASGKSLCYNVPVLEELTHNPTACALYLFPTKALAQDQLRALLELSGEKSSSIGLGVYDGDTNQDLRLRLRDSARLIITNPDMLHVSILPSHRQFERFLANLKFVVVDEAHAYRGVFGCHTALILRRLRRLLHHLYGAEPSFVVCSATVANPREHAMELAGVRDVEVIHEDGSPHGEKTFVFWNPPIIFMPPKADRKGKRHKPSAKLDRGVVPETQTRRASPLVEVSSLLAEMVQHNLRCIAFCNTRKSVELVHNHTREILKETAPSLVDTIRAYRAGYTAESRREIEKDLFGGRLRGVAATNALELGIDIGSLDATLHLGFPGSVASLWQQSGRAGRREKASLSVYVAFSGPLDQHFMKAPQKLFMEPIENAQVDASNRQVVEQHLMCAAVEYPLHIEHDEIFLGSGTQSAIMKLVKEGLLGRHPTNGPQDKSWHYIGHEKSPSQGVSIRAISPEKYTVINQATNEVIEEVEENKAFFEVYEGAVYMHQGKTFLCTKLDTAAKVALCTEADLKYYTKTRDFTDVHVLGGELAYPAKVVEGKYPSTTAQASPCKITTKWIGFRRIWQGTNETFDSVDLFLPEVSYESQAAWIRVPHLVRGDLEAEGLSLREGIHAASHALLNIMPLYIMCNSQDLGCDCANPHDTRYYPERLLLFDKHPGGIGIAAQVRPMFAELLQAALELLVACECTTNSGCPSCIQVYSCSEYNEVVNKRAAILILQGVINSENMYRNNKQDTPLPEDGFLKEHLVV
ncbi:hypothetical protein KC19_6G181500 [Ceratodon purpureus]|uniref:Uncharacterized protein n=1 Tax=Ceratodon purpureus TaxID=3225 RepID=A0A8T0HIP7_CERPU|nr:hypothetical protein KC19_6G181500 [Ceratodon purpureus]